MQNKIKAGIFALLLVIFVGCLGMNSDKEEQKETEELQKIRRTSVLNDFKTDCDTMYYRGTTNDWDAKAMSLVFDYVWKTEVYFPIGTGYFKFDTYGDWTTSYGDSAMDGVAERSGGNIRVSGGRTYKIYFNEKTKEYYVVDKNTRISYFDDVYFRGTPNNWAADRFTLVDDFTWEINTNFNSTGDNKFKFDIHADWTNSFGDADMDGFADYTYNSINLGAALGNCKITFNDLNKKYTVETLSGVNEPYIGPYLTWDDSAKPHNGIVVNYVYKGSTRSKIQYGLSSSSLSYSTAYTYESSDYYHTRLSLSPNTTYYYRIMFEDGDHTATYSFKTALENDTNFSYIVLGDMQDDESYGQRWDDVAEEVKKESYDFIIGVGDMIMTNTEAEWKIFFDKGKDLFASKAFMPVAGNHDTPTYSSNPDLYTFKKYFAMPNQDGSNGEYYGFKYGNSYFMALNSETREVSDDFDDGGVQYDWVERRLEENKDSNWLFAYYHVPSFNGSDRHYSSQDTVKHIAELFNHSVDWVFGGHVHMFQRTNPIRYNRYGVGAQVQSSYNSGTGYLIVPPAGNWPDGDILSSEADKIAASAAEIGYSKVYINNNYINIKSYGIGTIQNYVAKHQLDSLSYTKTNPTRKKYDQVYLRGSFNNWGNKAMTLVDDYIWETTESFTLSSDNKFKFDIYGNWDENYGEYNFDHVADLSAASIKLSSPGTYKIRFNDLSKEYSAILQ